MEMYYISNNLSPIFMKDIMTESSIPCNTRYTVYPIPGGGVMQDTVKGHACIHLKFSDTRIPIF